MLTHRLASLLLAQQLLQLHPALLHVHLLHLELLKLALDLLRLPCPVAPRLSLRLSSLLGSSLLQTFHDVPWKPCFVLFLLVCLNFVSSQVVLVVRETVLAGLRWLAPQLDPPGEWDGRRGRMRGLHCETCSSGDELSHVFVPFLRPVIA